MKSLIRRVKNNSNVLDNNKNYQLEAIKLDYKEKNIQINENINKIYCEYTLDDDCINQILKKKYKVICPLKQKQDKGVFLVKSDSKYVFKIENCKYTNKFLFDILEILKNEDNNNFIIKYTDVGKINDYYYYFYPYYEGMDLNEFLKYKKFLHEQEIKSLIYQIAKGIHLIHSLNIIHGDLKLENILINECNKIKIIDFDLSIICNNTEGFISDKIFGTQQYIAPESHDLNIYSKKTDVWQIGIILYYILLRKFPYKNDIASLNKSSNLYRVNIFKHINFNNLKKTLSNKYSEELLNLLRRMLEFKETDRISIDEILEMEWLKN